MGDNVFVNASRTEVVDEMTPGKKYQMRRKEAQRLGLLPDGDAKLQVRRSVPEDIERPTAVAREDAARTFTSAGPVPSTTKRVAKK